MVSRSMIVTALVAVIMAAFAPCNTMGFAPSLATSKATLSTSSLSVFGGGGRKEEEDLSAIESRDMTRAEMEAYNRRSEEIMNQEMNAMTAFSLVISLPILYLCWVAFFSD